MSTKTKLIKIALPLLIIVAGFVIMRLMIAHRPEPKRQAQENPGALVEILPVTVGERQVQVEGTGTVQARQEIALAPQVSGEVTEVAPHFIAGGFFRKGDLLFRIESADYRLAVDRARAALAKAEYELATVEGQAKVARREWARLKPDDGAEPNPLVVYEPQVKNAKASLLSARAALQQAELDLGRTVVRAPFDCLVRAETIDLGQYLRAGTQVATLAGTDRAEIIVPLALHELGWLQIPRPGSRAAGSPATIRLTTGGRTFEWQGRVVRTLGEVDPEGRMARAVVAVDDPYGMAAKKTDDRPQLAVGTFVQVILHGETLHDVAVLPAEALRDGGNVWVMNDEHLRFRPVQVLRNARQEVIIGQGLKPGERVVLTKVSGAAEGMKLRAADQPGEAKAKVERQLPKEKQG